MRRLHMRVRLPSIPCVSCARQAVVMTTLITGGTGKTGRRVAQRLDAMGHRVRIGSRQATPAFDWTDPTTWPGILAGCDSAYITFQPDLGLAGADDVVGAFAMEAVSAGCRRLVLLSGRGEDGARRAEDALIASGAEWTVVRSAFFVQNFTESFWAQELAYGSLTMVEHHVGEPFVDADDLVDVVVTALTAPGHVALVHEVTGPRLVTFRQIADEVGRLTGRPVRYSEFGPDAYVAALAAAGLPEADAAGLSYLFTEVLDGRNAHVTSTIRDVLGREPRDVSSVLGDAAAAGVWA
jgi:uncharacterized protein YbjT (DUF2867 family)